MPINVVITCDTPEEVPHAVQMRDQLNRMCDEPLTVKIKGPSTLAERSSSTNRTGPPLGKRNAALTQV